ncbi:MAG: YcjF family protein [Gemmataceae bacterium]
MPDMFRKVKQLFSSEARDAEVQAQLAKLREKTPVPVFWLFGKTQSGKTSLIKYLTGADEAEIGQGFQPCTRFSRMYEFPTAEAPLLTFLDTRGVDEPGYDPREDLARFDELAHVVVVTVKVLDQAQENVLNQLRKIRAARPARPVVLVLTCLHEAYPQQQHLQPYPFEHWPPKDHASEIDSPLAVVPETLRRSLAEQRRRFAGVVDQIVPVDLTKPEEGFAEPNYGGDHLKRTLLDVLPHAYRQTLLALDEAMRDLQDLYARHALPHIIGYSTLAATAGAIPIPWIDLLILPGIQTRMIYHLARFYGQPMTSKRFLELASTLGMGMLARQAARELTKFIPYVGSVASAALAGASTFALGKAFCYYYSNIHKGHVPQPEELRRYYQEQLAQATEWMKGQRQGD